MPYGKQGGRYPKRNSGGYGRRESDRDRGGRDSRGPRQMFDVTCGSCGDDCQVPFRPTGDRPVLCSNCFDKKGGRERFDGGTRMRSDRPFKKEFTAPKPDPRVDVLQNTLNQVLTKLDRLVHLVEELQTPRQTHEKDVLFANETIETEKLVKSTPKKKTAKKPTKPAASKKTVAKKKK